MDPNSIYTKVHASHEVGTTNVEDIKELELREVQDIFEKVPIVLPECTQYYVGLDDSDSDKIVSSSGEEETMTESQERKHISSFLQLPSIEVAPKMHKEEPHIDFSKSMTMTKETYVKSLEVIARKKEDAKIEKEKKKQIKEALKGRRAEEAKEKEADKLRRQEEAKAKKTFNELWSIKSVNAAGEKLHRTIREQRGNFPIAGLQGRDVIHPIYKSNQRISLERRRAKRRGEGTNHL
jgi:hypothetical protein